MKVTRYVVLGFVAAIAIVDILLLVFDCGTISQFLLSASQRYPLVQVAFGVLVGHLFWPQHIKEEK